LSDPALLALNKRITDENREGPRLHVYLAGAPKTLSGTLVPARQWAGEASHELYGEALDDLGYLHLVTDGQRSERWRVNLSSVVAWTVQPY
jgi:hypothetical protein